MTGMDFASKCVLFCDQFRPTALKERWKQFSWHETYLKLKESRSLILFIVFIAIFLDNMLLTTVVKGDKGDICSPAWLASPSANAFSYSFSVPIVPNFLFELDHPEESKQTDWQGKLLSGPWYECSIAPEGGILKHYSSIQDAVVECVNGTYLNKTLNPTEIHNELAQENVKVGLMFASKAVMQLIANPFVGPLTNRIGYSIPMFAGFIIMFVSTIVFALGENYFVLFVARAVQGIGSACSSTAGMGMIADRYTDDIERGRAMAIALSGLALGVLAGPPFGGVMYEFVGKAAPFIILAMLALGDGLLQLIVLKPKVKPEPQEGAALLTLLRDPFILIAAGAITFGNMGIAMLEPSLPLWMRANMQSSKWEQGAAFLPSSISYLIGTNLFGTIAYKMGRWLSAMIGILVIALCLFLIPFCDSLGELIFPNFGLGFSIGMVDAAMMPMMGNLVDLRHTSVYGSVYAIADVAFCLGFALGPALSGSIVKAFGFKWMLWIIAIIDIIFAPTLFFLRNPPRTNDLPEKKKIAGEGGQQYDSYNQNSTQFQQLYEEESPSYDYAPTEGQFTQYQEQDHDYYGGTGAVPNQPDQRDYLAYGENQQGQNEQNIYGEALTDHEQRQNMVDHGNYGY